MPNRKNNIFKQLDRYIRETEQIVSSTIEKNKSLIILAISICLFAYGYELFNFTLSIDEEIKSFQPTALAWIQQGRWSTFLLVSFFMPESLIPFLPTAITLIFQVISCFLFFTIIEGNKLAKAIFLLIFLSFPSAAYFIEFNTFNFAVSIGISTTLLSFLLLTYFHKTKNFISIICSLLLLSFSIGIYQCTITIWLCITGLYLLQNIVILKPHNYTKILNFLVSAIIIIIPALMLYKFGDLVFKELYSIKGSSYLKDNFIGWNGSNTYQILRTLAGYIFSHMKGDNFYGEKAIISMWLIIPFVLFKSCYKKPLSKILFIIIATGLIISSPFLLALGLGTNLPVRSLIALPFMVAGFWYIASINSGKLLSYTLIIAAMCIMSFNAFCTTRLFYADFLSWQADTHLANRILDRMYALDAPFDEGNKISVAIIGKKSFESNVAIIHDEVFGRSFFEWDGGNQYRILDFMKLLGAQEFVPVGQKKRQMAITKSATMNSWPKEGSVIYFKKIIIVKLSEI